MYSKLLNLSYDKDYGYELEEDENLSLPSASRYIIWNILCNSLFSIILYSNNLKNGIIYEWISSRMLLGQTFYIWTFFGMRLVWYLLPFSDLSRIDVRGPLTKINLHILSSYITILHTILNIWQGGTKRPHIFKINTVLLCLE